jgi:hypothetical protein
MTEAPDVEGLTHRQSAIERDDTPWPHGRSTVLAELDGGRLSVTITDDHGRVRVGELVRAADALLDNAHRREVKIGRAVRAGGRRGNKASQAKKPDRDQERAVVAFHAAALRKAHPGITTRELARQLAKHPKITRPANTIRSWLGPAGSSAPHRSTR